MFPLRSRGFWLLSLLPATCSAWLPGIAAPSPTRGFVVNTADRGEVVSFYHAVYMASEGYQDRIDWTGVYNSTAAGAEGTVSAEFVADVERRLNYYRAMCGVAADVSVNSGAVVRIDSGDTHKPEATTTKAEAAQRAALMFQKGAPSHNPAESTFAWTIAAWNACHNGNLARGFFGPGAMDVYFKEDVDGVSGWNVNVGHRRWLLCQSSTDFATGDTPGSFAGGTPQPPTNVMYVVPRNEELDFSRPRVFAAYPPAGYFPAGLNSPLWSLSFPGGDFSAATVTLRDAAQEVVPVSIVSRQVGYGNNSLVWQVPEGASDTSVEEDQIWNVTVSNIQGAGVPSEYSYQVRLIDPLRLNEEPVVSGDSSPTEAGGVYEVAGVSGADEMEAGMFLRRSSPWTEGAEPSPVPQVVANTGGSYEFLASTPGYVHSGERSFRLTFPTVYDPLIGGVPEQSFELLREIIPGEGGSLDFVYRRGPMTSASKLVVESSVDNGRSWVALDGDEIEGAGAGGDSTFKAASFPLTAGNSPLRVRFRYYYLATPGARIYSDEDYPSHATGIYIDAISASGCDWLEPGGSIRDAGLESFTFDSSTAGEEIAGGQEWWLRARAVFGGHAFPFGPPLVVKPVGVLQLIGTAEPPVSGANYAFIPEPGSDRHEFEVMRMEAAAWQEGAEVLPSVTITDLSDASYALGDALPGYVKSGLLAFRLGLSNAADNEDAFVIERAVIPSAASTLSFWARRGKMSKTNLLHAEISADDGAHWTSLWSIEGKGNLSTDSDILPYEIPLAAWADQTVKFRFAIRKAEGGSNTTWNTTKSGVWIDDIAVSSAVEAGAANVTAVDAGARYARLDGSSAGQALAPGTMYRLRLRAVSGAIPGEWGPDLFVTTTAVPLTGFAAWQAYDHPGSPLGFEEDADGDGFANGIEYAFSLDPRDGRGVPDDLAFPPGRMEISRELPVLRADVIHGAEWSDDLDSWSGAGVEIVIAAGRITASAPKGTPARFMRWTVTAN
ncbi:hypothetical protein [Luteolibacter marinus]|uniref:hypothetical protein n=1 Tax=Luteolibacter marinus TaxID=2776705 RepID=UPI00186733C7|nr:hypothetical protein [Luteolibacter marinus]